MKNYEAPQLTEFGTVAELTAVYGAPAQYDTFINEAGEIVDEGQQSMDICVSDNQYPDCVAVES